MPWHLARRLHPSRARSGAWFAVLVVALAAPAVTSASRASLKKPVSVPDCAHFPRAKMAHRIHVSPDDLFFMGRQPVSNACGYTAFVSHRYSDLLTVSVTATPKFVFEKAEQLAKRASAEARRRLASRTHTGATATMARVRPLSASNSG